MRSAQDTQTRAAEIIAELRDIVGTHGKRIRLMEVCGTHTVAIFRAGLRQILPEEVELVSGPGCPVCVTADDYIDAAIAYAGMEDVIITTFGDMLKVPGTRSSLAEAQAAGADVRIVYSPLDALTIAAENPTKQVVFLAVGFETTAPTEAAAVLAAEAQGIRNIFLFSAQKLVPPVMRALLDGGETHVDGFLLPGHVSVVTGTETFEFLARDYSVPGVVGGFEPLEILRAIQLLVRQIGAGEARIENAYETVVRPAGNPVARAAIERVYEPATVRWRGLGEIPASGLAMREEYATFDFARVRPLSVETVGDGRHGCRCGEVLRGAIVPRDCNLFGKACVPEHAIGPCMVSVEGTCAAWYKYGGGRFRYGA
ncbi:hydrogenase formation protein HypD [Selenomonas sp. oral taxon 138]|uniref:hydrogenase formation protein HypD n=1 Tax=Selenomonas sp. oral taxon 138 TaxID=712532 RepID=UPI0002A1D609|nr:hydrogenase formation protein HypD [Selenomonas sp. oral taxon 138]EKX97813.1 hydrogenase expression/formation protein HypD [Selenomonas sp. oral taxon 138 str. F0429]